MPGEMAAAVAELRAEYGGRERLLVAVAERLQTSPLHAPAVREALQCLIPEWLDPALDATQRKGPSGDADRVGVRLSAKSWSVDVSVESVLRAGRPLAKTALEFFLRVLSHVCLVLELPLYVGTSALGVQVGGPLPAGKLRRLVLK